jgi:hypothetical protein
MVEKTNDTETVKNQEIFTAYLDSVEFQEFIDKEPFLSNETVLKCKLPSKTEFMIRNLYMRGDS